MPMLCVIDFVHNQPQARKNVEGCGMLTVSLNFSQSNTIMNCGKII